LIVVKILTTSGCHHTPLELLESGFWGVSHLCWHKTQRKATKRRHRKNKEVNKQQFVCPHPASKEFIVFMLQLGATLAISKGKGGYTYS